MKSNKTDDLFRRGLKDFRHEPSAETWDKLAANLNNKKRIVYWKWAGIAASLLIFGIATTLLMVNNKAPHTEIVKEERLNTDSEIETIEAPLLSDDKVLESKKTDLAKIEKPAIVKTVPEDDQDPTHRLAGVATSQRPVIHHDEKEEDIVSLENELKTENTALLAQTPEEDGSGENVSSLITDEALILAENNIQATDEEKSVSIRIVYKKGESSSLLASNDKNLVKKSFEKIGEITENMKFSEERKARWRNTKDNILAFNIDQLFNNTNEEELEEIDP